MILNLFEYDYMFLSRSETSSAKIQKLFIPELKPHNPRHQNELIPSVRSNLINDPDASHSNTADPTPNPSPL